MTRTMEKTINVLELASELANLELTEHDQNFVEIYEEDDNGDTRYTEQAQDRFNELYDKYYDVITKL